MGLSLKTKPAGLAVDLAEAKKHLKIFHNESDSEVSALVVAAAERVENYTGRALLTQTWTMTLDRFPLCIRVPRPPLVAVTHIKYLDESTGVLTTLAADQYRVTQHEEPARIEPAYGESWPTPRPVSEAIQIEFEAGYGDTHETVPAVLKHAIKLMIGEWDQYREGLGVTGRDIPDAAMTLMNSERVGGLFVGSGISQ